MEFDEESVMNISMTEAFVKVEEFKGNITIIDTEKFIGLIEFVKWLKKRGFENGIKIGIEDNAPLLIFFR